MDYTLQTDVEFTFNYQMIPYNPFGHFCRQCAEYIEHLRIAKYYFKLFRLSYLMGKN